LNFCHEEGIPLLTDEQWKLIEPLPPKGVQPIELAATLAKSAGEAEKFFFIDRAQYRAY
jgi:hypothetical protein